MNQRNRVERHSRPHAAERGAADRLTSAPSRKTDGTTHAAPDPRDHAQLDADELFGADTAPESPHASNYFGQAIAAGAAEPGQDGASSSRGAGKAESDQSVGGSFNPGSPEASHGGYDWHAPAGQWADNPAHGNNESQGPAVVASPVSSERAGDRAASFLLERVSERLSSDRDIDTSEIEAVIKDAEVTLRGKVGSRNEKRRAETCTASVYGVRHVHNHLQVDPALISSRQQ